MPPRPPAVSKTAARKSASRAASVPARAATPPPEVIRVDGHQVACDGGGGALGHPLVYLEMNAQGFVECGYCDRRFEQVRGRTDAYVSPAARAGEAH